MTPAELHRIGALLYGERWQSPLARDLGVHKRTVADWAVGRGNPGVHLQRMLSLLDNRRSAIVQCLEGYCHD